MSRSNDDLFRGWRPTPASPELKERVISAVRGGVQTQPKGLTDRLWESRALRYGWVAEATVLVALNLWLPSPADREPYLAAMVEEPVEFDPVLAALLKDHLSPRTTWADQNHLVPVLLGEVRTVATDATASGENS
jgi:hypothetical protein